MGAFSRDELLTWNGKTEPGRKKEREKRKRRFGVQTWHRPKMWKREREKEGERRRKKKCSQKWSSMNQSLPRSFHHDLYLSRVLYGLCLKNCSWTTSRSLSSSFTLALRAFSLLLIALFDRCSSPSLSSLLKMEKFHSMLLLN